MGELLSFIRESAQPELPTTGPEVTAPEDSLLSFIKEDASEEQKIKEIEFAKQQTKDIPLDVAVQAAKIKKNSVIPYQYIIDNFNEIKKEAKNNDFDVENFAKNSPLTADWLSKNPEYTPIFRESFGDVSFWESAISGLKGLGREAGSTIKSIGGTLSQAGLGQDDLSQAEALTWFDAPSFVREGFIRGAKEARRKEIEQGLEPAQGILQKTKQYIGQEFIAPIGRSLIRHGKEIEQAKILDDPFHTKAGQLFLDKLSQRPIETFFTTGLSQAPNIALTIGSAVLAKKLPINTYLATGAGAYTTSFILETGDIYTEGLDFLGKKYNGEDNIPKEELNRLSYISRNHGMFNAALDALVPASQVARSVIAQKGIRKFLSAEGIKYSSKQGFKDLIKEVSTEVIQEESSIQAREKTTNKEVTWNERINRYAEAGVGAFGTTTVTSSIASRQQIKAAQEAVETKAMLDALADHAKNNEILKNSPDAVKSMVEDFTKNGPVEDVYIPAQQFEEYFQSKNIDPKKEAQKVGISEQEYDDAIARGYDLKIKTSEYASKMAAEHGVELSNDIRFDQSKMTNREAEALFKEIKKQSEEIGDQSELADKFRNTITEKLVAAGYTQQEAEYNASFHGMEGVLKGGEPARKIVEQYYQDLIDIKGPVELKKQGNLPIGRELSAIEVNVETIDSKTGETVVVKKNAKVALDEAASEIEKSKILAQVQKAGGKLQTDIFEQDKTEEKKGFTRFAKTDRSVLIGLFESKDLSTFIHESGHLFLQIYGDVYEALKQETTPDASQINVIKDYEKILKFLGVESRTEIKTEQHEKFARAFELYLGEGKAPNVKLRGPFAKFRNWMAMTYKKARRFASMGDKELSEALDVKLNNEVRAVLDRMIATEESINAAEAELKLQSIFTTAEDAGMTEEEFAPFIKHLEKANELAKEAALKRALKEYRRQNEAEWNERKEEIHKEVAALHHAMPIYKALYALRSGTNPDGSALSDDLKGIKVNKKELMDFVERNYKDVETKIPYGITSKNGQSLESVAEKFGYSSFDKLFKELSSVENMQSSINQEVAMRMDQEYGNVLIDGSLELIATEEVLENSRDEVFKAEMAALKKKMAQVKPFVKAEQQKQKKERARGATIINAPIASQKELRAMAEGIIAAMVLKDIKPSTYLSQQRKAASAAIEFTRKGEYEAAYLEKHKQRLSIELYKAANNAIELAIKIEMNARHLSSNKKRREKIGLGGPQFLENIDAILEDYEFKKVTNKRIEKRRSLREFIDSMEEQGVAHSIPQDMIDDARQINYKELTINELITINDTLDSIENIALDLHSLLKEGKRVALDSEAEQFANQITTNIKSKKEEKIKVQLTGEKRLDTAKYAFTDYIKSLLSAEDMLRQIDGNQDVGPAYRILKMGFDQAYNGKYETKTKQAVKELEKINELLDETNLTDLIHVPSINREMSKEALITITLNTGTESNLTAILESKLAKDIGLNLNVIREIADLLTKKEMDYVKATWDFLHTFYPQIKETYERRTGVAPEMVEGHEVITKHGTYQGRYFPLKYNKETSIRSSKQEFEQYFKDMISGVRIATSTKHGFAYERVGSAGMDVILSLNVIAQHVNEVLYDLHLGDEIRNIAKILNHAKVKKAFESVQRLDIHDHLTTWLGDIAVGELSATKGFAAGLKKVRVGLTISSLAWNLGTAAIQVTGIFHAMAIVGPGNFLAGQRYLFSNPYGSTEGAIEFITNSSSFMANRQQTFNRDVSTVINELKEGWMPLWVRQSYFLFMQKAQWIADVSTWYGAFHKGMKEYSGNVKEAVLFADRMVVKIHGSGIFADRSALERGTLSKTGRQNEGFKLFTTMMSAMIRRANNLYGMVKETDFGSPKEIAVFAANFALIFMVDAILIALAKGKFKEDDDWERKAKTGAKETALSVISSFPIVKQIAAPIERFSPGGPIEATAKGVGELIGASVKFVFDDGKLGKKDLKNLISTIGIFFHLPGAQTNKLVDFIDSDDKKLLQLIFGGNK